MNDKPISMKLIAQAMGTSPSQPYTVADYVADLRAAGAIPLEKGGEIWFHVADADDDLFFEARRKAELSNVTTNDLIDYLIGEIVEKQRGLK